MSLLAPRTHGRSLMVLDDAETIARQARRRAAARRRQRERLQQLGAAAGVLAVVALLAGASPVLVGGTAVLAALALGGALHTLHDRQAAARRRRMITMDGSGIGAPRPKGGFSTTRHRSGAPVWVRGTAADQAA